jgi:predicted AAA+ superfamily ATPase
MPKVYFYDIGLRNFFANNFESILLRSDRCVLLENAVVRQLLERVDLPEEKLRYWRSKTGAEVDFIFDGKIAFEVKFDANIFRKSKYRLFLENYPHINLNIVSVSGEALPGYMVWNPCFL